MVCDFFSCLLITPGSSVALDCIDSWYLPVDLLRLPEAPYFALEPDTLSSPDKVHHREEGILALLSTTSTQEDMKPSRYFGFFFIFFFFELSAYPKGIVALWNTLRPTLRWQLTSIISTIFTSTKSVSAGYKHCQTNNRAPRVFFSFYFSFRFVYKTISYSLRFVKYLHYMFHFSFYQNKGLGEEKFLAMQKCKLWKSKFVSCLFKSDRQMYLGIHRRCVASCLNWRCLKHLPGKSSWKLRRTFFGKACRDKKVQCRHVYFAPLPS